MGVRDTTSTVTVHGPRATIVLDGPIEPDLVAGISRAVVADDPLSDFLAVVSAAGVRHLPGFIYVGVEAGRARLLARGELRATVRQSNGKDTEVGAAGVSTWTESVFDAVTEIEIVHPGGRLLMPISVVAAEPAAEPAVAAPVVEPVAVPVPVEVERPSEETIIVEEPVGPVADDASAPDDFDLANLFETKYTGVEAAAVRDDPSDAAPVGLTIEPPVPAYSPPVVVEASAAPPGPSAPGLIESVPSVSPEPPPAPLPDPGDHDGMTISAADLAAARAQHSAPAPASGSSVQAVLCRAGHLNPPHAAKCRSCASDITDRTISTVTRPVLGRLHFEAGMVVDIDRPLLIGRKPTADVNLPGSELPGLVTVPDPDSSLSRVHAELRIDGWEVLVVDRESKNGTFVELPGEAPVMLRPLAPFLIVPGTRIALADVAACTYLVGR